MYAIIADSGRQYKVEEGQRLAVDYREASAGDTHEFERVLAVSHGGGFTLGEPVIEGAKVTATVLGVEQGPKLVVQKFRRRKNSRRKTGHRQLYTLVQITSIDGPGVEKPSGDDS